MSGKLHVSHPATLQLTTQAPDTISYPVSHAVQELPPVQELQLIKHGEHPLALFL